MFSGSPKSLLLKDKVLPKMWEKYAIQKQHSETFAKTLLFRSLVLFYLYHMHFCSLIAELDLIKLFFPKRNKFSEEFFLLYQFCKMS